MTGYGRGEADCEGIKLSVELSTVNRKQSEIAINLPRDLTELEARIRQAINARISRGRTNVLVAHHASADGQRKLPLCRPLRHLGRTDATGKSPRAICPSFAQRRAGRSRARIHRSGNFSRVQHLGGKGE